MTRTTKHIRESGATTVIKDGKIVGNIGAGKTKTPTAQDKIIDKQQKDYEEKISPLSMAETKFVALRVEAETKDQQVSLEAAQALLEMTNGQPIEDRLLIFSGMIDKIKPEDREQISDELKRTVYKEKNSRFECRFLSQEATGDMLHALVYATDSSWLRENQYLRTDDINVLYELSRSRKSFRNWDIKSEVLASLPNASAEFVEKVLTNYDNETGVAKPLNEDNSKEGFQDRVQKSLIVYTHILKNSHLNANLLKNISEKTQKLAKTIREQKMADDRINDNRNGYMLYLSEETAKYRPLSCFVKELQTKIVLHPKTSLNVVRETIPTVLEHDLVDIIRTSNIKKTTKKLAMEELFKKLD